MNRYAKIFLTIITVSLLLLNLYLIRNVDVISNAYAVSDQSSSLLDEEQCQAAQQAVGSFLGIADYLFKESEIHTQVCMENTICNEIPISVF